jgi:hypothetical protein
MEMDGPDQWGAELVSDRACDGKLFEKARLLVIYFLRSNQVNAFRGKLRKYCIDETEMLLFGELMGPFGDGGKGFSRCQAIGCDASNPFFTWRLIRDT